MFHVLALLGSELFFHVSPQRGTAALVGKLLRGTVAGVLVSEIHFLFAGNRKEMTFGGKQNHAAVGSNISFLHFWVLRLERKTYLEMSTFRPFRM